MSRVYTPITAEMADYVRSVTLREPEALRRLRVETENHPNASCQIAPEQGQFLQVLARAIGAVRTLEVGVFMGYSSTWVALGLPEGGKVVACDRNAEYAERARRTWREAGVEGKVELRLGAALDSLDALLAEGQAGTFDLAFIDADKENYLRYYERALTLLRPKGLVVADNVLWHGRACDANDREPDNLAIRAFNRALYADQRIALSIATIGDGFAVACKL